MKILHVNGVFSDSLMYQENYLIMGLNELGHDVYLITGRYEPEFDFNKGKATKDLGVSNYHGTTIIRLPDYFYIKNSLIALKGLYKEFSSIKPDNIFFHGVSTNLLAGIFYKFRNPDVVIDIDFHTTSSNSGNSKLSWLFHGFCKLLCQTFTKSIRNFFCVAPECQKFAIDKYGLPISKLPILPLPGKAFDDAEYDLKRMAFRNEYQLDSEVIVFSHIGKMPEDKETELTIKAFLQYENPNARLVLAGSCSQDFIEFLLGSINEDKRIIYIEWLQQSKLQELLCGSDVLIQPGSLSQVFVDGICARLPIILDNTPQGSYLTQWNNGILTERSQRSILNAINEMGDSKCRSKYKSNSNRASFYFDYKNVSKMTL
ncbi:glycosyltransferase [Vibrio cyclitrophicus]